MLEYGIAIKNATGGGGGSKGFDLSGLMESVTSDPTALVIGGAVAAAVLWFLLS